MKFVHTGPIICLACGYCTMPAPTPDPLTHLYVQCVHPTCSNYGVWYDVLPALTIEGAPKPC